MGEPDQLQVILRMEARQIRIEKMLDLLLKALDEEVEQVSTTTLDGDVQGGERNPNDPL